MPLQTRRLALTALSVAGDVPPNAIQPRLRDGIHLRWSFEREAGFPWFGYYLFRRTSSSADRTLQRVDLGALPPSTAGATAVSTAAGELSSDAGLALRDDFAPAGTPELDLEGRSWLRFVPADLASVVRVEIGFRQDAEIELTARLERVPVAVQRLRGKAGELRTVELTYDAISEVEIGAGPAALTAIGALTVSDGATAGWQPLPGFPSSQAKAGGPYPLCLPVAHPDYTCPGAPATAADAAKLALDRVRYALPGAWTAGSPAELHDALRRLVDGGPAGPPMASKQTPVSPVPPDPRLRMPGQAPLDLLLLGALHPGVAQMLGLAWVDETVKAAPAQRFDYLIVADHDGRLGGTATGALQYLRTNGFGDVDAFIVFGKWLDDPSPRLDPPADVRAYALPGAAPTNGQGGAGPAGAGADVVGGVGLRWDRGVTDTGALLPGRAVLYHLWRAELGDGAEPGPPAGYAPRTEAGPILVADPPGGTGVSPPSDWPPFRLHVVDGGLPEGWYGYQVSGVDVFGRHSPASAPASWHQWAPPPTPPPWYYRPPASDAVVHPSAVAVLDKTAPPPPTGVEAAVLDPDDPLLVADAAYTAWRAALPADEQRLVGLRVSWLWTRAHMEQAPDTREFRVYYQPGRLNTVQGRVTGVIATTATDTTVQTDIANPQAADAWVGARLLVGNSGFRILGSDAADPLRLRVANIGAASDVRPPARASCSVAAPESTGALAGGSPVPHPLHVDYAPPASWARRVWVVGYDQHVTEEDGGALRRYELFLPVPGDADRSGAPLAVSAAEPLLFGTIGVSAADDRRHTADDPARAGGRWGGADRYGNEGRVGPPATVFRVYRGKPPTPELPTYQDERLLATAADYHGSSYFTVRWVASAGSGAHVLRALDRTLFQVDRRIRSTRGGLDPAADAHAPLFPDAWIEARKQAAAAELNALAGPDAYGGLSVDARELLAALPGNDRLPWDAGLRERDWEIRRSHASLGAGDAGLFPPDWNDAGAASQQRRQDVADELNALAEPADYERLSGNGLRVLAGLPGNEAAFAQLTIAPLDPDDPACADRRGPDSPDDYAPSAGLRAFVDTLDGRSSSSYLYRLGCVNAVHTRGDASLALPPVSCPDVTPPRTPLLTKVLGGDREITLRWASNREPDLAAYLVYRAGAEADTRDLRLMTLVHTAPVGAGPPAERPASVSWTDSPVPGLVDRWYRLVAVDTAGNASAPTAPVRGRAYDQTPPEVPALVASWTAAAPPAEARLAWTATDESLAEVRGVGLAVWQSVGTWRPPGEQRVDLGLDPARGWRFRLRVRKATGAQALGDPVPLAPLS